MEQGLPCQKLQGLEKKSSRSAEWALRHVVLSRFTIKARLAFHNIPGRTLLGYSKEQGAPYLTGMISPSWGSSHYQEMFGCEWERTRLQSGRSVH